MKHSLESENISQEKQTVIFQTKAIDENIYIREQKGYFQKIRRSLSWLLMVAFILIPMLTFEGKQAILFDVAQQQFHFYSIILFPQDFLIFCLIFILAAFLLFYFTSLYGRIWCGYTCPQTVWLLMFNWVERRVEGSHRHSKHLNQAKISTKKVGIKLVKHTLWLFISLTTALVFMSYFVPVKTLYTDFFTFESSFVIQAWVYFFTLCTYINAGWLKEKMCLHVCPYARFQSVMIGQSTKLVAYDNLRGESRGPRKRNTEKPADKGDCIDCKLCVEVCPVGIDIRNGFQYECINCGLCADACDAVMDKFNYAKGLIKYQWQNPPKNKWLHHASYALVSLVTVFAIISWTTIRSDFEVSISRDRQSLYRINTEGKIENIFTVKILNKTSAVQSYSLNLKSSNNFVLRGEQSVVVKSGEQVINTVSIIATTAPNTSKTKLQIEIIAQESKNIIHKEISFYSGSGGW